MLLAISSLVAESAPAISRAPATDDEPSFITLFVVIATVMTLSKFILDRDERKLTANQMARAWPPASRMAPVVFALVFMPLALFSLFVHFVRTRRSMVGALFGVLVVVCVLVVVELVAQGTEWLLAL